MGRKFGIIGLLILFIALGGAAYLHLKERQSPVVSPWAAIPTNTAMVLEVNKAPVFFKALLQSNEFFTALQQLEPVETMSRQLTKLDTLLKSNQAIAPIFSGRTLYISWHKAEQTYEPLFLMQVGNRFESAKAIKTLGHELQKYGTVVPGRKNQMRQYRFTPNADTSLHFYILNLNGILAMSANPGILEQAVNQASVADGLRQNKALTKLIQTSGTQAEAHLYLQFTPFMDWFSGMFASGFFQSLGIHQFADWAALDLNLKGRTVLINGFADSHQSQGSLARLFDGQQPVRHTFERYLPSGIESFTGFGISNMALFRQNLASYLATANLPNTFNLNDSAIRTCFGPTAVTDLELVFAGECAQVVTQTGGRMFMYRTKGHRDAVELTERFFNYYTSQNNVALSAVKTTYKFDNDMAFDIYQIPVPYIPANLLGPWFKACQANYMAVYNDFLVFANDVETIKTFLYSNILQRTLQYDVQFIQFADYLTSESNLYLFVSLTGSGTTLRQNLNNNAADFITNNKAVLRNFYGFGWQFTVDKGWLYNNYLFRYQPTNKVKAATEWETRLDTTIAFKPVMVINHNNAEKEVFLQDMKNNVYLINNAGRIVWKQTLDEPIMGDIYQVDYYRNGKLQYLFNTRTKLHLIDRIGNNVEKYPVKLKTEAVVPMSLFDYDNRKDYRIMIAGTDNQIYVYGIDGKLITGFEFKGTDHTIVQPVEFFRDNNKDYLVIADKARVYLLDRRGLERVKLSKQFEPSVNNRFIYQKGNNNRAGRLVRTDTQGNIYYLYFDGRVEQKSIQPFSANHFFEVQDITSDGSPDFIFVDNNKLGVYNITGELCFDKTFSTNIRHQPAIYKFGPNKTLLGVTEADARKIYLIDKNGQTLSGFPLPGMTRFSIGILQPGSSYYNLIVGGDEQYLYNYKLN